MTFLELQADTIDLCQELNAFSDLSPGKIKHYLNRAQKDFVRQTKCLQADIDITAVVNQVSYTSADAANLAYVYHVINVRYISPSITEQGHKLVYKEESQLPEVYQYGVPHAYWVSGNNSQGSFKIGTFPIAAELATIRVKAFIFPTAEMSSDTGVNGTPVIKDAWQDALPIWAASKLFGLYGHKSQEFFRRSRELKQEYQFLVDDYNARAVQQTDEFTQVEDIY